MKKTLLWLVALTAALALNAGCSGVYVEAANARVSAADSIAVPAPKPVPVPSTVPAPEPVTVPPAASAPEPVTVPPAVPAPEPVTVPPTVPALESPSPLSYKLDRSVIPADVNTQVTMLATGIPVAYEQVLDDAERQGDQGNKIDLTAYRLSIPQIKDLAVRCVNREVLWQLDVDGVMVRSDAKELDLSGHNLSQKKIDLYKVFEVLPNLKRVDICKTGFTNAEYAALQDTFPNIRMIWEIVWSHWTFRTDVVAFSTMKYCSDPFFLYDNEAQYLRYCTDLVALDLGHNCVRDWSFLQYMPNLKILIAVDNRVQDLSWLKYTPKLEYLEFFVGKITDLSFLQYTPNMVDLNISYNPMSDATYLYNLPKLERLWMEHTNIPYKEFEKLQKTYPNAKLVYYGSGSIDQGWRTHERFYAMRDMFKKNYVHELFKDKEPEPVPKIMTGPEAGLVVPKPKAESSTAGIQIN